MSNIEPKSIYIIVEAKPDFQRTNEFTLNDEKGNVIKLLERRDNMIVMTEEEFEWALNNAIDEHRNY